PPPPSLLCPEETRNGERVPSTVTLPSPRTAPAAERTSPEKEISVNSKVELVAASCSAARPVRFRRSIDSDAQLNVPFEAGQSMRPSRSSPRSSDRPPLVSSLARHCPRIN